MLDVENFILLFPHRNMPICDSECWTIVNEFVRQDQFAVFPALQDGPHNHQIGALAVGLKQAASPAFKAYAKQVRANVVAVGKYLMSKDYTIVTGGTENHLVLWDLRPLMMIRFTYI
ncbi:Glycine hydroxymethyltransferase [Heracleum sosnowskyi]|uniref:Glycine hydroxymethyltransferase n=1 Tax=Heracleum sosnowskyi TaxID=360622 RepID=A0AAD8I1B6_9APIA|nr:Glycine hydroxymethyltransferase [Heracleum sosnowskyi]